MFLTSLDSSQYHPTNQTYNFTVELPQTLEGAFTCALLEFFSQSLNNEELYVYCDICESSLTRDRMLPLIRIVPEVGEVNIPYFLKITRPIVQRIRIYIRDRDYKIPDYDIGPIRCTLGFV